jgi:hypothetical protein
MIFLNKYLPCISEQKFFIFETGNLESVKGKDKITARIFLQN